MCAISMLINLTHTPYLQNEKLQYTVLFFVRLAVSVLLRLTGFYANSGVGIKVDKFTRNLPFKLSRPTIIFIHWFIIVSSHSLIHSSLINLLQYTLHWIIFINLFINLFIIVSYLFIDSSLYHFHHNISLIFFNRFNRSFITHIHSLTYLHIDSINHS